MDTILTPEISFLIAEYIDNSKYFLIWLKINTKLYLNHDHWRRNLPKLLKEKKSKFISENHLILCKQGWSKFMMSCLSVGDLLQFNGYLDKPPSDLDNLHDMYLSHTSLASYQDIYMEVYHRSTDKGLLQGKCTIYSKTCLLTCSFNKGLLHGDYTVTQVESLEKDKEEILSLERYNPTYGLNLIMIGRIIHSAKLVREKSPIVYILTGKFKSGKMNGLWTNYDFDGKAIRETTYKDGIFVKTSHI